MPVGCAAGGAPGSDDGSLAWWVDGSPQTGLTGLDNGAQAIDEVHLGLVSQTGDANAPVFDAVESHRSTYIGPSGSRGGHVELLGLRPAPQAAPRRLHERPLPQNAGSAVPLAVCTPPQRPNLDAVLRCWCAKLLPK